MYKRILVPLDGSPLAECSLPHVRAIAQGCSVPEVILLRVVEPVFNPEAAADARAARELIAQVERESAAKAKDYLDRLVATLRGESVTAQSVTVQGKPADEIVDFAQEHNVDLVIMSTHGRSGVTRWLMGSVADRVLRHASVPVLLVSPAECRASS